MGRKAKSVEQKQAEEDQKRQILEGTKEVPKGLKKKAKAACDRHKKRVVSGRTPKRRGKHSNGPLMSVDAQPDRKGKAPEGHEHEKGVKKHPERSKYPVGIDGRTAPNYVQCTRIKKNGERCRARAKKGKDLCRCHGGNAPIKHGMYSRYTFGRLEELVSRFKEDPDLKSLKEEVALLRAVLQDNLRRFGVLDDGEEGLAASLAFTDTVLKITEGIRKCVHSLVQIEEGLKLHLDIGQINAMVLQITTIITQEIRDDGTKDRVISRLAQLVSPVGS